jgi:hypothetical protein
MSAVVLIFDAYFLFLVMVIFLYHRNRIKKARDSVGAVFCQWSTIYDIHTWRGLFVWIFLLTYLSHAIYFILKAGTQTYGVHSMIVFLFSLGFYQRWIVVFGEKGFVRKLDMIPWKDVQSWETDIRGKLSVKVLKDNSMKQIRIRVPRYHVKKIENMLIRSARVQKE